MIGTFLYVILKQILCTLCSNSVYSWSYLDVSLRLHKSPHHPQCSEESWFLWCGCRVSEKCRYYGVIWPLPPSNTVNVVTMQRKVGTTILWPGKRDFMKTPIHRYLTCTQTHILFLTPQTWSENPQSLGTSPVPKPAYMLLIKEQALPWLSITQK